MNDCPVPMLPLDPLALAYIGLAFGLLGLVTGAAIMRALMLAEVDAIMRRLSGEEVTR